MKTSTAISRGHNSTFVNQKTSHKLISNRINSNKDGRGFKDSLIVVMHLNQNQPNLTFGRTIETLQPLISFLCYLFLINYTNC